jgi:hypothetical protein
MSLDRILIAGRPVSRLIVGGNPFSGFSHQSPQRDREMVRYYTTARIKETLAQAEDLGINTFFGRADHHIRRMLTEYWDEGGTIQWFAQTSPEYGMPSTSFPRAAATGASACYIHGGQMDYLLAQGMLDEIPSTIEGIREAGMAAGLAGHNPQVFQWAEAHVDVDFYMCSYYNPTTRDQRPEHIHGAKEWFAPEDREVMVRVIQGLSRPAVHYKVMAAGRNDAREAFDFVARHLRPQDAVCVGFYLGDNPRMLEENVELLNRSLAEHGPHRGR